MILLNPTKFKPRVFNVIANRLYLLSIVLMKTETYLARTLPNIYDGNLCENSYRLPELTIFAKKLHHSYLK